MVTRGQAMPAEGQRTGDQDLIAHGEHRMRDGQTSASGLSGSPWTRSR